MKLTVLSDYGSTERLVTTHATRAAIEDLMASLDWSGFHQVILERPNGDWLEVGGSLDPSDGLSVMFQETGEQYVIEVPPTTQAQMTVFLLGYLSGDTQWKDSAQWS